MKRHRIATTLTLALFAGLVIVPAGVAAPTGPLLSGYGGPGAGDQAILGSTLVGVSGRGGGSGGGSSGSSGGASGGQGASGLAVAGQGQNSGASRSSRSGKGARKQHRGGQGRASNGASSTYRNLAGSDSSAIVPTKEESGGLGLTGSDLLVLLLVAGTLVLIGGLTRRLARTALPGE
jgi:hypothetical protein